MSDYYSNKYADWTTVVQHIQQEADDYLDLTELAEYYDGNIAEYASDAADLLAYDDTDERRVFVEHLTRLAEKNREAANA